MIYLPTTVEEIRDRIAEICCLFGFDYKGKRYCVEPYSSTEFELWFDDETMTVDSIDKVMSTPFVDGKSISEVVDEIDIVEW